jgi:ribosomal protein L35AE/L33A
MTLGEFDRAKINNEEGFCTVYVEDHKTGAAVVMLIKFNTVGSCKTCQDGMSGIVCEDHKTGAAVVAGHILLMSFHGR